MDLPAYTGISFTKKVHNDIPTNLLPSNQPLKGPFVACITGASRGIGAATAVAFAQAGATGLVLTARKAESLQDTAKKCKEAAKSKELQVECLGAEASADEAVAIKIASVVKDKFGRLDVLINNAGILSTDASAFAKVQDMRADQIQIPTEANYIARVLTIKHLAPILIATDGPKTIVNVSSIGSHLAAGGALGFSISVFANNRLSEWIANSYKDEGLSVYAIHPGAVLTTPPPGMPEWVNEMSKDDPALLGSFCLWLVRGEKKDWLNGRYLSANWDVEELENMKDDIVKHDKLKMRLVI